MNKKQKVEALRERAGRPEWLGQLIGFGVLAYHSPLGPRAVSFRRRSSPRDDPRCEHTVTGECPLTVTWNSIPPLYHTTVTTNCK